jgi:hypothetical protein
MTTETFSANDFWSILGSIMGQDVIDHVIVCDDN